MLRSDRKVEAVNMRSCLWIFRADDEDVWRSVVCVLDSRVAEARADAGELWKPQGHRHYDRQSPPLT